MSHKVAKDLFRGDPMVDPKSGGTINVDRSPAYVPLESAGAETRTLAAPSRAGAIVTLAHRVDAGDITLTVTGGYNEEGDTSFTFDDVGQFLILVSVETAAGTYVWRKMADYVTGNVSVAELSYLAGVTAGTQAANKAVVADANVNTGVVKATQLHIGASGSEVQVTATPKEINSACDFPAQGAVTATADGLTTGLINPASKNVLITSDSADKIATLPGIAANSLGIGHTITGSIVATGCEIRSLASSSETINGVDASGGNEAALAANTAFTAIVVSATGWLFFTGAAVVPD